MKLCRNTIFFYRGDFSQGTHARKIRDSIGPLPQDSFERITPYGIRFFVEDAIRNRSRIRPVLVMFRDET